MNALQPDQHIDFNPKLTIAFGGKCFRQERLRPRAQRIAAVRSAEPVLPISFPPLAHCITVAHITFQLGGEEETINWQKRGGRGSAHTNRCI